MAAVQASSHPSERWSMVVMAQPTRLSLPVRFA